MDGDARPPERSFRVNPVDRLGRRMSAAVHDAAEEIAHRAVLHAEKLHIDPAVAASLLEEAAARVSRAIDRKTDSNEQPVRDLRAYLFRAFLRLVNKAVKRQLLVADAIRTLSVTSHNSTDPLAQLERKILVDELLTRGDPVARDMGPRYVLSAYAKIFLGRNWVVLWNIGACCRIPLQPSAPENQGET